jgi:hypothetical protein
VATDYEDRRGDAGPKDRDEPRGMVNREIVRCKQCGHKLVIFDPEHKHKYHPIELMITWCPQCKDWMPVSRSGPDEEGAA